eukprot:scaffold4358_cov177-Ochromonas_danica.AAC.31
MAGRQQDIEAARGASSLALKSESGSIATIYECHRSYLEGSDPFGGEEWQYYEFVKDKPKLCQTDGKLKDFGRGISMWEPHCFPKILLDKRNDLKAKCKKLKNTDGLPAQFNVLFDRTYDASIGGIEVVFTHYLLTPSGQFEDSIINTARDNLNTNDCTFEAAGGEQLHDLGIDFDDCERAVGSMNACQRALKDLVNDLNNPASDRCDALVLYAWLGCLEATVDELVGLSPWASEFILEGMKKYGQGPFTDSNILLNFIDAKESLKYQLERFYSAAHDGNNPGICF